MYFVFYWAFFPWGCEIIQADKLPHFSGMFLIEMLLTLTVLWLMNSTVEGNTVILLFFKYL